MGPQVLRRRHQGKVRRKKAFLPKAAHGGSPRRAAEVRRRGVNDEDGTKNSLRENYHLHVKDWKNQACDDNEATDALERAPAFHAAVLGTKQNPVWVAPKEVRGHQK